MDELEFAGDDLPDDDWDVVLGMWRLTVVREGDGIWRKY